MSDFATGELLAFLGVAGGGAHTLEAMARMIDCGKLAHAAARPDELAANCEMDSAIAIALVAAFEVARRAAIADEPAVVRGAADVAAIARREIGGLRRERVITIVCDAANRPLRTVVVSDGAIDRSLMPVREILNAVLRWDGRAFAVAHNHPCGSLEPSNADVAATQHLADAAGVVGLRFLGHIVVAGSRHRAVAGLMRNRTPG